MAPCSSVPAIHIFAVVLGSLEIILFAGVIFGWHSVVYIYKDTGYFSDLCPGKTLSPEIQSVTVHSFTNGSSASSSVTISSKTVPHSFNDTDSVDVIASPSVVPRTLNVTDVTVYRAPGSKQGSSIHFDELSCEEQLKAHSEGGVSTMCKPQDEQFNLIFSLSTGINGMMCFPSGFLYDRLGTRISRIISIVCFLAGQLCLIFASPFNPYLLYPGFVGLVYGGYQILLTNLQLSCLIPSLRSTVMSLYSGSYDTSASIFLLFKAAHEGGVSVNTCFTIQAVLYVLIFASTTFLFLPSTRIPFPLSPGYRLRCYLCHKFCGRKRSGALEPKTYTSSVWEIDAHGSVILARAASRNSVDDPSGPGDVPIELKTDMNGRVLINTEPESLSDGAGDSSSSIKEKKTNLTRSNNKGDSQSEEDTLYPPSHNDNGDAVAPLEAEISSPANDEKSPSAHDNKTVTHDPSETERMLEEASAPQSKTFRQVALSPLFLTDVMWISVQRLRSWIFVGLFNPWITQLACGDKALVSHYTSVYAALQFFGILTAPLSGRLMDRKIKGAEKYGDPRYERLHAAIASFVLNSTVSILLTVCTMIPVLKLQYLTFVLHCLHRSFLYGPNSAFVANAFPNEHFGKLFGVTLTVSALFSVIQYPLFLMIQGPLGGDPLVVNVLLLVLMVISYLHPFYIWRYLQKKVAKRSI